MDPSFYEDVFVPTTIEELDFVRTPFYDLAKLSHLKEGEDAQEFVTNLQEKALYLGNVVYLLLFTMTMLIIGTVIYQNREENIILSNKQKFD